MIFANKTTPSTIIIVNIKQVFNNWKKLNPKIYALGNSNEHRMNTFKWKHLNKNNKILTVHWNCKLKMKRINGNIF